MSISLIMAALLVFFISLRAATPARPNVLLIISDDQGYGDLSWHGNLHLRTSHLDRLAPCPHQRGDEVMQLKAMRWERVNE